MATVRAIKLYGAFQGYGNQSEDTIEDLLEIFPNEETAQEYLIQIGPTWTVRLDKIKKFMELGRQLGDRSFEKFPGIQAQYDSNGKYQGSCCPVEIHHFESSPGCPTWCAPEFWPELGKSEKIPKITRTNLLVKTIADLFAELSAGVTYCPGEKPDHFTFRDLRADGVFVFE